jgi:hypothetical protein
VLNIITSAVDAVQKTKALLDDDIEEEETEDEEGERAALLNV